MGARRGWGDRCAPGLPVQPCSPSIYHSTAPHHRLRAPPRDTGPELGASPAAPAPLPAAAAQSTPACPGDRRTRPYLVAGTLGAPAAPSAGSILGLESGSLRARGWRWRRHPPPPPAPCSSAPLLPSLFLRLRASPHRPLSMARRGSSLG